MGEHLKYEKAAPGALRAMYSLQKYVYTGSGCWCLQCRMYQWNADDADGADHRG